MTTGALEVTTVDELQLRLEEEEEELCSGVVHCEGMPQSYHPNFRESPAFLHFVLYLIFGVTATAQ